jgi:ribose transport system ATP-binding protein
MLGRAVADVAKARTRFTDQERDVGQQPVLRATGMTRRHVLNGVSLEVRPGEVLGLAGLLGSGRTETAKAIYGIQPIDDGRVEVDGQEVPRGSPRTALAAGIALIPEDRKAEGIIPSLSVRDNIVLAALPSMSRSGFLSDRKQDEVVARMMGRLRIKASSPDQKVGELSGGNQQKVLLARVLALNPRVLLLDDPTRGIDVGAKAEIQALISELAGQGIAVVLISSELEEVVEGADTITVLRDGAVVGTLDGREISEEAVMTVIAEAARESIRAAEASPPTDVEASSDVGG